MRNKLFCLHKEFLEKLILKNPFTKIFTTKFWQRIANDKLFQSKSFHFGLILFGMLLCFEAVLVIYLNNIIVNYGQSLYLLSNLEEFVPKKSAIVKEMENIKIISIIFVIMFTHIIFAASKYFYLKYESGAKQHKAELYAFKTKKLT